MGGVCHKLLLLRPGFFHRPYHPSGQEKTDGKQRHQADGSNHHRSHHKIAHRFNLLGAIDKSNPVLSILFLYQIPKTQPIQNTARLLLLSDLFLGRLHRLRHRLLIEGQIVALVADDVAVTIQHSTKGEQHRKDLAFPFFIKLELRRRMVSILKVALHYLGAVYHQPPLGADIQTNKDNQQHHRYQCHVD